MKKNNNRFLYLISPNKIYKKFFQDLEDVLSTKKVEYFQLRLKKTNYKKKITNITKDLNCSGCHLGQKDMSVEKARKIIKNKIIGLTCHNSKLLVKKAIKNKVDYIALGAFFKSKTKKTVHKANIKLIRQIKMLTKIPIVAIGGINYSNYKILLLHKVNFLAISGYIWNNKKLNPKSAIKLLKNEN